jgi:hypothetical protein
LGPVWAVKRVYFNPEAERHIDLERGVDSEICALRNKRQIVLVRCRDDIGEWNATDRFTATSTVPAPFATSIAPINVSGTAWTLPVLALYRFKTPLFKPFVEAGISFDHLPSISAAAKNITSGPGELIRQPNAEVVLGGGIDCQDPFHPAQRRIALAPTRVPHGFKGSQT